MRLVTQPNRRTPQHLGPLARVGLMAGLVLWGHSVQPCQAQQRSYSYKPSLTGPSSQLQRNFGRIGGWLGTNAPTGAPRSPSAAWSSDLSNPMRQRRDPRFYRRPGMGQADMDMGYGLGAQAGRPLILAPRPSLLAATQGRSGAPRPVMGALSSAYSQTLRSQQSMAGLVGPADRLGSSDYLTWIPRETSTVNAATMGQDVAVLDQPVVSDRPDAQQGLSEPKQSLGELVSNHVTALRRSYVERGWDAFAAGDYQGSLRMFSLADHASLDDPQERANVKMAMVYVGIAAGQFSQAVNSLEWLVSARSQGGQAGHAEAFNQIFIDRHVTTIGDLYVRADGTRDSTEYQKHNLSIETMAARDPDSPRARALTAMVEWGRGRRDSAIFEAKKIQDPSNRLTGLVAVLQEAERLNRLFPRVGSGVDADGLAMPPASGPAQ